MFATFRAFTNTREGEKREGEEREGDGTEEEEEEGGGEGKSLSSLLCLAISKMPGVKAAMPSTAFQSLSISLSLSSSLSRLSFSLLEDREKESSSELIAKMSAQYSTLYLS